MGAQPHHGGGGGRHHRHHRPHPRSVLSVLPSPHEEYEEKGGETAMITKDYTDIKLLAIKRKHYQDSKIGTN